MNSPVERTSSSIFLIPLIQVFLGLTLLCSLLYGLYELTLFSLILLCMGIITSLWSRKSLTNVHCSVKPDRTRLFPDESFRVGVQVTNTGFLPLVVTIQLSIDDPLVGPGTDEILSKRCGLLWFQRSSFHREFGPGVRGVHSVGPLVVKVGDIFGFFRRERIETTRQEIIIYPRIVETRSLPLPKREFFGIPGARSPVEDPAYILGTRDYQPGRPARNIHWKASARHSRLQEKLFESSEQEKILMALDVDQFIENNEKELFEKSIEVLATQAVRLVREGNAVGFVSNCRVRGKTPGITPVASNGNHLTAILEHLARLCMESHGSIGDILAETHQLPWGLTCMHVSYGKDENLSTTGHYLRHRNIPTIFVTAKNNHDRFSAPGGAGIDPIHLDSIILKKGKKK